MLVMFVSVKPAGLLKVCARFHQHFLRLCRFVLHTKTACLHRWLERSSQDDEGRLIDCVLACLAGHVEGVSRCANSRWMHSPNNWTPTVEHFSCCLRLMRPPVMKDPQSFKQLTTCPMTLEPVNLFSFGVGLRTGLGFSDFWLNMLFSSLEQTGAFCFGVCCSCCHMRLGALPLRPSSVRSMRDLWFNLSLSFSRQFPRGTLVVMTQI